jgi:hypothetical protein
MGFAALEQLDESLARVAAAVHRAHAQRKWQSIKYGAKFTPTSDVWSSDYDVTDEQGVVDQSSAPDTLISYGINKLAHAHWRLTQDLGQPRWYKMILTVHHDGKYSVDFEYRDNYKEGDIMERG